MNFIKLQVMQQALDDAILKEKPEMTKEERFEKTLVALSVEIAELANTAEHFKFWKDNKGKIDSERFITTIDFMFEDGVRNDKRKHELLKDTSHLLVDSSKKYNLDNLELLTIEQAHKLTLVEEASDCLHFILSLANQQNEILKNRKIVSESYKNTEDVYKEVASVVCSWYTQRLEMDRYKDKFLDYISMLGITTQELEQAYYDKNEINYQRLKEGY